MSRKFMPQKCLVATLFCYCLAAGGLAQNRENHADISANEEASPDDVSPDKGSDDNSERAALVRVRLPLVGSADVSIRNMVQRTAQRLLAAAHRRRDLRRPVLVLQLEQIGRAHV